MNRFIKWLFTALQSRDSKSIEIYFEALNVWWLFILWNPSTSIAFDITSPVYIYILGVWTAAVLFVAGIAILSKKLLLRLAVILSYAIFYFLTGFNLLLKSPIAPLGGVFICQGVLATFLLWKLYAKQGTGT